MIRRTGPYEGLLHEVVEYNGVLYFGGVIAEDLSLDMVGQAADVLRQVDHLLALHGSTRDRVLSALVFVSDLALKPALNGVWKGYFRPAYLPARAAIGVTSARASSSSSCSRRLDPMQERNPDALLAAV